MISPLPLRSSRWVMVSLIRTSVARRATLAEEKQDHDCGRPLSVRGLRALVLRANVSGPGLEGVEYLVEALGERGDALGLELGCDLFEVDAKAE